MDSLLAPETPNKNDDACHTLFRDAPTGVEFNKLRKRLIKNTREALDRFGMVVPRSDGRPPK
ncbi:MAG: hypothetical protein AAF035_10710, partial [Pseudomonadota bacterium]